MDDYSFSPDDLPDLNIERLGPATVDSPLISRGVHFVEDDEKIAVYSRSVNIQACRDAGIAEPMLERAGPRRKIYFDPGQLRCGIVTCGGLCPGRRLRTDGSRLEEQPGRGRTRALPPYPDRYPGNWRPRTNLHGTSQTDAARGRWHV